jgi:threonine/homoserine/homoserine lactone efflux protein
MALPSPPPDRAAPQPLPTGLRMLGWALLVFGMIILVVFVVTVLRGEQLSPVAFLISAFIIWMGVQMARGKRWWEQVQRRKRP